MAHRFIRPALAAALGLAAAVLPTAAQAQLSPSAYTSGTRYDAMGRVTGTIAPDPDGAGALKYLATRNTYNAAGRLVTVETGELSDWQSESVAPENWTGFTAHTKLQTTYDVIGRKTIERMRGVNATGGTPLIAVTQYSYDNRGRLECTAVRMNPAVYGSLPASACNLGTEGTNGPDRITKNIYDAAGQLLQVRTAVGTTSLESAEVTYTYTDNGKQKLVIDANGNKAELRYDGHDRQVRWVFPAKTRPSSFDDSTPATAVATAGALHETDYELYGYDPNGNRTSLRKRDGSTIGYEYDALNRMTKKTIPDRADLDSIHERNVHYAYDLRGLMTEARFGSLAGPGITTTYDGFGRKTAELQDTDGNARTISSSYDRDGNRIGIVHPDSISFGYTYDGLDRLQGIKQGGTELGTLVYNDRGLPQKLSWYYGAANLNETTRGFDSAGRLNALALDVDGTSYDVAWSYARNPASQILSEERTNDAYAWNGHANLTRNYTTNGLNQYTAAGPAAFCYDDNGNLTADGTSVYLYDVENRLVEKRAQTNGNCSALSYAGTWEASLRYDPMGRLFHVDGPAPGIFRFVYDGDALALEYNGSGAILRRYVHGADAGADDPLVWYEGSAVNASTRRYMHADPRGSIVLVTDYQGTQVVHNTYDEYGIPGSTNDGRFQYTGQAWIPELGMYYYKARIYSPTLGRFLQTDPIGYEDQWNLYAYVGNDPVNKMDPTGEEAFCASQGGTTCTDPNGITLEKVIDTAVAVLVIVDVLDGPLPDVGAAAVAARAARAERSAAARAGRPSPPNPHGSKGKPDHQAEVARQERLAREEAGPNETVVRERKAVGTDRTRIPDVQTRDSTGRTVRVREVERQPNSQRVREKREDYEGAGIRCNVVDCNGNPK